MTDDNARAMLWLEVAYDPISAENDQHRATIKRMLTEPRLPEDPTPEMLNGAREAILKQTGAAFSIDHIASAYRALYAELTRPPTREVETWYVEYAIRGAHGWEPSCFILSSQADAERDAEIMRQPPDAFACVRVTGPHRQQVPA
jgi:hypothetical protein